MNLLLILIPLIWLVAAMTVVAVCRVASLGDARLLANTAGVAGLSAL